MFVDIKATLKKGYQELLGLTKNSTRTVHKCETRISNVQKTVW